MLGHQPLQLLRREGGEVAAFALGQRDVADGGLAFETFDHVGQAVGRAVEVGVIDLGDIAGEDDLGALADAADDRLDLVRREVLDRPRM